MQNKKKNKRNLYIICGVVLVVLLLAIGVSYGAWSKNIIQSGENLTSYDCFSISYDQENSSVLQLNSYPQSDAQGLTNSPYTISIDNSCSTTAKYELIYNVLNTSTLSSQYVKVSVDDSYDFLDNYQITAASVDNASKAYILDSGLLDENESITLNIRSWMDYDTTTEQGASTSFESQISVNATATTK